MEHTPEEMLAIAKLATEIIKLKALCGNTDRFESAMQYAAELVRRNDAKRAR